MTPTTIAATVCILFALSEPACSQNASGLNMSVQMLSAEITEHEPVLARLLLRNNSRDAVKVTLGGNFNENLLLMVAGLDGKTETHPFPPRPMLPDGDLRASGTVSLLPGGQWSYVHVLNRWRKNWPPGTYQVSFQLADPHRTVSGTPVFHNVPAATLRVLPQDRIRLERRLHQLLVEAQTTKDTYGPAPYIRGICLIDDPMTVPFLGQLLRSVAVGRGDVYSALERIGTEDSVDALLEHLSKLNRIDDDYPRIVRSLEVIERRTSDERLKDKIQRALR